jgi:glycosyltransferase involved in cell wall biosynthesis
MEQRIRVLEVTKSTAGVAEYVRWLAQALDKSCFEITVACLSENGPRFASELSAIEGVRAFSLEMNRYKIDPVSDLKAALELKRRMQAGSYDLVHAHASKPGVLARLAASRAHIPVIYSPHCFSFHAGVKAWKATLLAKVEGFLAKHFTARILAIADSEKELANKYNVGKPEQFSTVYTGIDSAPYEAPFDRLTQKRLLGLPEDTQVVGCVGRLNEQKAPFDFIRIAELVIRKNPGVHFLWVGDGPLLEDAVALRRSLGLEDQVHFSGHRSDIPACLSIMDCFLLASRWEGFPIVVLEAMAAGVPVVATQVDGTREAVQPGVTGFLAPPGDIQALAQHVSTLLSNPHLRRQFRLAAKKRIREEFNRERMVQDITRVYMSVADGGRR